MISMVALTFSVLSSLIMLPIVAYIGYKDIKEE